MYVTKIYKLKKDKYACTAAQKLLIAFTHLQMFYELYWEILLVAHQVPHVFLPQSCVMV